MREIKFRGKSIHNGKWIYGYAHVIDTIDHGYTGIAIQQQNGKSRPFSVTVDKKSVGQYTGICDKNGVEIYEGDIIGGLRESNWHAGKSVVLEKVAWNSLKSGFCITDDDVSECEVIGNIYEHSHLLEDQQ